MNLNVDDLHGCPPVLSTIVRYCKRIAQRDRRGAAVDHMEEDAMKAGSTRIFAGAGVALSGGGRRSRPTAALGGFRTYPKGPRLHR
jgi:hypothetical protein